MVQRLVVAVESQEPHWLIRCEGELDFASYPDLEAAILEGVRTRPERLELDLRGLTFMDSAGVRMIALAARSCADEGISFVVELSQIGERVLASLGFEDLVPDLGEGDEAPPRGSDEPDPVA